VSALFETTRRHDGKVDCTAEIDEVGVRGVLDFQFSLLDLFFVVAAGGV